MASAAAGLSGGRETRPDGGGEIQDLHRPRCEGGSMREGVDGASKYRVAPLGCDGEGSAVEQRVALEQEAGHQH